MQPAYNLSRTVLIKHTTHLTTTLASCMCAWFRKYNSSCEQVACVMRQFQHFCFPQQCFEGWITKDKTLKGKSRLFPQQCLPVDKEVVNCFDRRSFFRWTSFTRRFSTHFARQTHITQVFSLFPQLKRFRVKWILPLVCCCFVEAQVVTLSSRRVWWLIRAGTGWQSSTTESCYTVALSIVWKCWYFIYLYWISVL